MLKFDVILFIFTDILTYILKKINKGTYMEKLLSLPAAILPAVILVCGLFYLVKLRFFFVLHPLRTINSMFSDRSQLRQISLSLAGTLGVGNIVGVAVAIVFGGAGAVFWMWISALVSMILKYAEITLAVRYREITPNGEIRGGPMYYMKNGVGGKLGRILGYVFALLGVVLSFSMGNIVQSKAAVDAVCEMMDISPIVVGVVLAVLCALSVFGGYNAVSRVTSVVVPIMSALYIFFSLRAVIVDITLLPSVMLKIISSAFDTKAEIGGVLGFFASRALRQGVSKGAYSHEAGAGTAPLSHSQTKTKSPARQGLLGLFEVFFDTIVICTLTAFMILMYGGDESGGMSLVSGAFNHYFGASGKYFLCISIIAFAFSTLICWGYYGKTCFSYICKSKTLGKAYLLTYCAAVVLGAVISEGYAWVLTDVGVSALTFVNLVALMLLWRDVKKETDLLN